MIVRNRILHIALLITVLYAAILQVLPAQNFNEVLIALVFSDPVMLGFMFTGVMILFEKSGNTLQALAVTPVRPGEYFASKALSLTLLALLMSLGMTLAGAGTRFGLIFFLPAVIFTSVLFVFIGIAGASRVKTFNQYFIVIPICMAPAVLPFLNFFQITDTWIWYVIPTQASLLLFQAALEGTAEITGTELTYAFTWLPLSTRLAYLAARRMWEGASKS